MYILKIIDYIKKTMTPTKKISIILFIIMLSGIMWLYGAGNQRCVYHYYECNSYDSNCMINTSVGNIYLNSTKSITILDKPCVTQGVLQNYFILLSVLLSGIALSMIGELILTDWKLKNGTNNKIDEE